MQQIAALLVKHEGLKLKMYYDTLGHPTIGIGRALDVKGISEEEAMFLLNNDIKEVTTQCQKNFKWFDGLCDARKDVILSMVFNIGLGGFLEFKHMILALEVGNYELAATEMTSSHWASQVGQRSVELAEMMLTGAGIA